MPAFSTRTSHGSSNRPLPIIAGCGGWTRHRQLPCVPCARHRGGRPRTQGDPGAVQSLVHPPGPRRCSRNVSVPSPHRIPRPRRFARNGGLSVEAHLMSTTRKALRRSSTTYARHKIMQINLNPTSERGASRDAVNRPRETLGDSHLISSDPRSRFGLVCDLLCCRGDERAWRKCQTQISAEGPRGHRRFVASNPISGFRGGRLGRTLTPECPHLRISVCCRFEELCLTPSKARRVGTTCRDVRTGSLHHWLTPAVVLLFGLGWTGGASASSVSSAGFDAAEHAQHCNCGAKCRQASCCCGPRNPKVRPPLSPPVPGATEADSTPCLKSSPCQGSGLPTAPIRPDLPAK